MAATGIVQLHGQGVLEIDAAADRFRRLTVRQTDQELQHTDGGQWGGGDAGASVTRIPARQSSSHHRPSSRSLTHIAAVPPGLLARAICAVTDGTCSSERERSDNGHLDNCIGLRDGPEHAR